MRLPEHSKNAAFPRRLLEVTGVCIDCRRNGSADVSCSHMAAACNWRDPAKTGALKTLVDGVSDKGMGAELGGAEGSVMHESSVYNEPAIRACFAYTGMMALSSNGALRTLICLGVDPAAGGEASDYAVVATRRLRSDETIHNHGVVTEVSHNKAPPSKTAGTSSARTAAAQAHSSTSTPCPVVCRACRSKSPQRAASTRRASTLSSASVCVPPACSRSFSATARVDALLPAQRHAMLNRHRSALADVYCWWRRRRTRLGRTGQR